MTVTYSLMILVGLLAAKPPADPDRGASILPFVGDEVAIVIDADLNQLDPFSIVEQLAGAAASEDGIRGPMMMVNGWVSSLKAAGAARLYLLIDVTDMPGYPVVVVPLAPGANAVAIKAVLSGGGGTPVRWPAIETIRGAVVAGPPASIARLKIAASTARPEVVAAIAAAGDAPIALAFIPSKVQRRALEESIPALPPELGGGDVRVVTQGMAWASVAVGFQLTASLHAVIETKSADATSSLVKMIEIGMDHLKQLGEQMPTIKPLVTVVTEAKPSISGSRITLSPDLLRTGELLAIPIQQARESARRTQCVNNLKQLGLAMHNFHATNGAFPAAYTKNAEGKPLLSWRVQILPFLEQSLLYKEFHQDEPWDGPHNKTLIARMPDVFTCPSSGSGPAKLGKTTYLAPRGPSTIFAGGDRVKLQDITDGTSNTIFVVDAPNSDAVIWTKPDDWQVPATFNPSALIGHHPKGFNAAFADGSVRFILGTIAPSVLSSLTTRDGGEVISFDSF